MTPHSLDDIIDAAPDRRTFAAAKKLAVEKAWQEFGRQPNVLWGLALGSGSQNYAVYVDLGRDVLECNCPDRKRPCKHALALLILDANGHDIPEQETPRGLQEDAQRVGS